MAWESMLSFDECQSMLDTWLAKNHNAKPGTLRINRNGGKNNATWSGERGAVKGTVHPNFSGTSAFPMIIVFNKGSGEKFTFNQIIDDLEGTSKDAPTRKLMRQRYALREKALEKDPKAEAEHIAHLEKLNKEAAEQAEVLLREENLSRLMGATVAQYVYVKAKNNKALIHHVDQLVKTPNEHPYVKSKGFDISQEKQDDVGFYILPKFSQVPNANNLQSFIKSNYFELPLFAKENNITRTDLMNYFEEKKSDFNFNKYVYSYRTNSGAGVVPAMDASGVVTSCQFMLAEKEPNFDDSKAVIGGALSTGVSFTFNATNKSPKPNNIIVAEGWATAYDLNEVFRNDPKTHIVCAFTASQLELVVGQQLEKHKDANIGIAADNDCKTMFNHCKRTDKQVRDQVRAAINTGLSTAVAVLETYKEHNERMMIIAPRFNHKNISPDYQPSDFNDLKTYIGFEKLQAEVLTGEIVRAGERKKQGISEQSYYAKIYNMQAKYFSELYQAPFKALSATGVLGETTFHSGVKLPTKDMTDEDIGLMKSPIAQTPTPAVESNIKKTADNNIQQPVQALNSIMAFLDSGEILNNDAGSLAMKKAVQIEAEVTNTVQSKNTPDYSATLTHEAIAERINEIESQATTSSNMVVNIIEQAKLIKEVPEIQPMVSPIDITENLFKTVLVNQTIGLAANLETKQDIENILTTSCSINNFIKASYALMDDTMGDHAKKEFSNIVDRFEIGTPIRGHLESINNVLSEASLQFNAKTLESVQETQASISEFMIKKHQDKGLDADNVNKMMHNTILDKSLAEKRAFYRDFRDTIHNIQSSDEPWLKELSTNLKASLERSKTELLESDKNKSVEQEMKKENHFLPT